VFLLFAMVEIARGLRLGPRMIAVVYVITAIIVAANLGDFQRGSDRLRAISDYIAPGLRGVELARGHVDPTFKPEPLLAGDVVAGPYLRAVDKFGSPATPAAAISQLPEEIRRATDAVLENALRPRLEPSARVVNGGAPPRVERVRGGSVRARASCVRFEPAAGVGSLEVLGEPAIVLHSERGADARVRLRRFAAGYGPDDAAPGQEQFPGLAGLSLAFRIAMHRPVVLSLPDGQWRVLRLPRDSAPQPWHIRVRAKRPVVACTPAVTAPAG
jgi:hypothetical protein